MKSTNTQLKIFTDHNYEKESNNLLGDKSKKIVRNHNSTMRSYDSSTINKNKILEIIDQNKQQGLGEDIKYLSSFKGTIDEYIKDSEEIMTKLHNQYKGSSDSYLPWVRYFDILEKLESNYGFVEARFKEGNSKIIQRLLFNNLKNVSVDWRIVKKMLSVKTVFEEGVINVNNIDFIKTIRKEFDKIEERMLWENQDQLNIKVIKEVSGKLLEWFEKAEQDLSILEKLEQAIVIGRCDKVS